MPTNPATVPALSLLAYLGSEEMRLNSEAAVLVPFISLLPVKSWVSVAYISLKGPAKLLSVFFYLDLCPGRPPG